VTYQNGKRHLHSNISILGDVPLKSLNKWIIQERFNSISKLNFVQTMKESEKCSHVNDKENPMRRKQKGRWSRKSAMWDTFSLESVIEKGGTEQLSGLICICQTSPSIIQVKRCCDSPLHQKKNEEETFRFSCHIEWARKVTLLYIY